MKQIYVDLDGVLADFYGQYEKIYGEKPEQDESSPEFWDRIRAHPYYYRTLPVMPDALILWQGVKWYHAAPIILTGIPYSIPNVATHKREWVREIFGKEVTVICCPSRNKCLYGNTGDILIDDRKKYSHYWTDMGGVFVHHTSAQDTLAQLSRLYGAATL